MDTISAVPPNQRSTDAHGQSVPLVDLKDLSDRLPDEQSVSIPKVNEQPVVDPVLVEKAMKAASRSAEIETEQLAAVRAVIPEKPSGEDVSVATNPLVETTNVTPQAINAIIDQEATAGTLTNKTSIDELLKFVGSTFPATSTSHQSEAKVAPATADRRPALNPDGLNDLPAVKVEATIAKQNEQPGTLAPTTDPAKLAV